MRALTGTGLILNSLLNFLYCRTSIQMSVRFIVLPLYARGHAQSRSRGVLSGLGAPVPSVDAME